MRRKTYKKGLAFILAGSLCLTTLTGCGKKDGQTSETTVVLTTGFEENEVFRIGKSSCWLNEAMVYLLNMQNQYENVYGRQIWEKSLEGEPLEEKLKDIVVARIAQIKTMNLLAAEYGVTLNSQELSKVESAAKKYWESLNESEKKLMQADEALIKNLYTEYALANKVYNEIIEDINPEISDDEARTITVKTIFIKTFALDGDNKMVPYTEESKQKAYQRAVEIKDMAKSGEDFDNLIQKYNEEERSTYSFGKGEMEKAFEDTAFNLSTDEISEVVETEHGYYIIRCVSTFDRKETDANKEKIVEKRKKEAFNQVYDEFVSSLLRNFNEKLWDKVSLPMNEEVKTSSFFQIYNEIFGE